MLCNWKVYLPFAWQRSSIWRYRGHIGPDTVDWGHSITATGSHRLWDLAWVEFRAEKRTYEIVNGRSGLAAMQHWRLGSRPAGAAIFIVADQIAVEQRGEAPDLSASRSRSAPREPLVAQIPSTRNREDDLRAAPALFGRRHTYPPAAGADLDFREVRFRLSRRCFPCLPTLASRRARSCSALAASSLASVPAGRKMGPPWPSTMSP